MGSDMLLSVNDSHLYQGRLILEEKKQCLRASRPRGHHERPGKHFFPGHSEGYLKPQKTRPVPGTQKEFEKEIHCEIVHSFQLLCETTSELDIILYVDVRELHIANIALKKHP